MFRLKLNLKINKCVFLKTGKTDLRGFKRSLTIFCLQVNVFLVRAFRVFQTKQVLSVSLDTIFSKYVFLACLTKYFTSSLLFKFRVVFLLLKSAHLFHSMSNVSCEPGRQ